MSGEETPKQPSNIAFLWQILASFSPLVLLVVAAVLVDTLISAVFVTVFVEALALALAVSTVFIEELVLATISATFFFPARGFLFMRVLLSGWEQHVLFLFCARVTRASPMASLIKLSCVIRY